MKTEKLIINAALTGIIPAKDMNPFVPVTPQEIAEDARRVQACGASIIHIHARDSKGNATADREVYREIIGRVREHCPDIVITVSTSGRKTRDLEERMDVLGLDGPFKPDMASLTAGSINFIRDFSPNPPETIMALIERMKERGIRPEIEIFDTGMANYARYLVRKGDLEPPLYANLILGSLTGMQASERHLEFLVSELAGDFIWAATGIGRYAFQVQRLALALGGHVRVGIEDSIFMDAEKTEPATNEKLVGRIRDEALAMGREIATPAEVRKLLKL